MIDVCSSCQGVWVDVGELDELFTVSPTPDLSTLGLNDQGDMNSPVQFEPIQNAYRHCPCCGEAMGQQNYQRYSGVMVDVCRFHGMFLDPLELEKILVFKATGGIERVQLSSEEENLQKERNRMLLRKRNRIKRARSNSDSIRASAHTDLYVDVVEGVLGFLKWLWRL